MLRVRTIWLSRGEGWFWKKYPRSIQVCRKKTCTWPLPKKNIHWGSEKRTKQRNVIWRKGLMCAYVPIKSFLVHKTHICTKSHRHPLKVEWSIPCHLPTESLKCKLRLPQDKQNLWVSYPKGKLEFRLFFKPCLKLFLIVLWNQHQRNDSPQLPRTQARQLFLGGPVVQLFGCTCKKPTGLLLTSWKLIWNNYKLGVA